MLGSSGLLVNQADIPEAIDENREPLVVYQRCAKSI